VSANALNRLLGEKFGEDHVVVKSYGNVLSATAFLYGLADHELEERELDEVDLYCPVLLAARARKAENQS
jgi:hypothetical protein